MSIDTTQILQSVNIVDVVNRVVPLTYKRSEYYGICPFHDDSKESLQVNERKQIFKCFACGAGGDAIQFHVLLGRTFHEACKELTGQPIDKEYKVDKIYLEKKEVQIWQPIIPAPSELTNIEHFEYGMPSLIHAYRNEEGKLINYTCRFDLPEGKKEVLPLTFAQFESKKSWRWLGVGAPRPLYNLDLISNYKNATIIFVEGEKTADIGNKFSDPNKAVFTTWTGGANSVKLLNLEPVKYRKKIFIPDNDVPGMKAMYELYQLLKEDNSIMRWCNIPSSYPQKWDIADNLEWTNDSLRQFILDNITDVPTLEFEEPKLIEESKPLPPPLPSKVTEESNELENEHFRLLGFDKDESGKLSYMFFSYGAKMVIRLSPSSMTKPNLITLAPLNYWEENFPGKQKINIDAVQNFLMNASHEVGIFKDAYIRGRGAWMDEGKLIVHNGDNLIIENEVIKMKNFRSKYVYEINERLGFKPESISMDSFNGMELIDSIKWLKFEREINAYLLAGWCVLAPFCGVLQWRPHIWITGPAGSGKSWTMDNIVKRLTGAFGIVVQGQTTEAYVRGTLQSDARPVLFDESDIETKNDAERIKSVLQLARSASYSDGGVIGKGTQSGGSRTYTIRSMFALSSIGVHLNQQSDKSRFTTIGLVSFEKERTKEDFSNFEKNWNKLVTKDYVNKIQSRTMQLIKTILANTRVFSDAAAEVIGTRRTGDQIGVLLAGAYSLISDKLISYDEAVEWVASKDWSDEKALELTKDEYQLFAIIMGTIIRVEGEFNNHERSIGELILIASGKTSELTIKMDVADKRLRRIGIIVTNERVIFSNTANGIKQIIKDTSWSSNHNKILERLPGAEKTDPKSFYPGLKSRGVSIPLTNIMEGLEATSEMKIEHHVLENIDEEFPF